MNTSLLYLDIFGHPIKHSEDARKSEFSCIVAQMVNLGLIQRPQYLGVMSFLTAAGYISAKCASYFLAGRFTPSQENVVSSLLSFLDNYPASSHFNKSLFYLMLWQKTNAVKVENTFLFPLEELAFDDPLNLDFSSEKVEYEL